ncbi:MAG: GNAT family N-acetyltransferase [Phycisphaerae bacterium]|jgi:ribosomal-protein-alanine N-acetyltransferase
MTREPPLLETPRLRLRLGRPPDIPAIIDYYRRNRDHLAPYMPARPAGFYTPEFWRGRLGTHQREFTDDRSVRLFVFAAGDEGRVIGTVSFTEFCRGPLQACYLGYTLDHAEQGRGLMTEALVVAIAYVFDELKLHRIMAGYVPTNERSANVLRRLGFTVEGYARDYLLLNGRWRDHILTSLVHPDWRT